MATSRSSSPQTPDVLEEPHNVAIHNDLPSWCHTLRPLQARTIPVMGAWDNEEPHPTLEKPDDERMLELNDLIEEHAYEDSPGSGVEHSPLFSRPPSDANCSETTAPTDSFHPSAQPSPQQSEYHLPSHSHLVCTPIVPPPAIRPRKRDSNVVPRRVICPPRESCYNLVILTPNIPKSGTKSRVETQIRVTVDLAHVTTPSDELSQYDRVGSWKWLKLPPGTSTKRRTRREGKIDPAPADILHLTATVTCASVPYNTVLSCGSCRNREAKRVARKLAARVRPARSDSEGGGNSHEHSKGVKEDTTSIIQFNCPEVLDFSSGSAVLPVRITCYCRHHREKIGFHVHLTMMDNSGYVVGTGVTPPIMITDDHKSTMKSGMHPGLPVEGETVWSKAASVNELVYSDAPKRTVGKTKSQTNKRVKPYDTASRNNSLSPAPLQATFTPTNEPVAPPALDDISMDPFSPCNRHSPQSISLVDTISSPVTPAPSTNFVPSLVPPHSVPFVFFDSTSPQPASLSVPKIHRLIPSSGPTHGGIEVTILGENFHPAVQLTCIFGDVVASSTQRWSDNTLLCVLPPRGTSGVVAVWFDGIDKTREASPPPLFTYTDESDRALMELALQVVGLKMTGKIEDAKNVALRIVSTTGAEDPPPRSTPSDMVHTPSTSYDIQPMFLGHSDDSKKFEASVLKLLSLVDFTVPNQADITMATAVSQTTASGGQTLLHLIALLDLPALMEFLIAHNVDLDVRDHSGYTALHFAALARSKTCATLLLTAGADPEIVNLLGKTPQEIAPAGFFDDFVRCNNTSDGAALQFSDDGDSQWGDIETDDDLAPVIRKRQTPRFARQRSSHRMHDTDEEPCTTESLLPPPKDAPVSVEETKGPPEEAPPIGPVASTSEVNSEIASQLAVHPPASVERSSRPVGYEVARVAEQDGDAYGYIPVKSHANRKQKHDRMLVLFWLPILLISLLWAFHSGFRFVTQALKTTLSEKAGVYA